MICGNIEDNRLNRAHFFYFGTKLSGIVYARVFSPKLIKINGLVNQVFTRPFSLVVQKVVQISFFIS